MSLLQVYRPPWTPFSALPPHSSCLYQLAEGGYITGMTTVPDGVDELNFWSFIELANARLAAQGFAHPMATEVLLTLNRASSVVTYDLESAVHRPKGWSWAQFRLMYVTWLAGPVESKLAAELSGMSRAAVSNLTKPLVA